MNKQEAIEAMKQGVKITHTYFSICEWMTMKNGKMITEEGYSHPFDLFWSYRTGDGWENGYRIYSNPTK